MPEPNAYDLKECTLKLVDGAGTPATLSIKFDEGTLTFTKRKNREYRKDRGILDTVREGDQEPCDVSFEGRFNVITSQSGDPISVMEFLDNVGAGSGLTTTGGACEPYCVDLQLEVDHDCGTTLDEVITFSQFRYEEIGGDFRAGTISVTGKCNAVGPTAIRTTL